MSLIYDPNYGQASVCVDRGSLALLTSCLKDVRGNSRISNNLPDLGALEANGPCLTPYVVPPIGNPGFIDQTLDPFQWTSGSGEGEPEPRYSIEYVPMMENAGSTDGR